MELNPVIIFGAKEMGLMALEIFESNQVIVYCFLDDDKKTHQTEYNSVMVMSTTDDDDYIKLLGKKCDAFIAIENIKERKFLAEMLEDELKLKPVSAIHSEAVWSPSCTIGDGNLVNAGTIIATKAKLGNYCILQNRVVLEAFSTVQDFVQIGSGAIIGQGAVIESGAFIGAGAIIVAGVKVGKNARVGAGSLVAADVKAGKTVFGNPAVEV
jgi:sugar O-acyltransferase (sialic acid O-acetyltransferase NeuD family)